MLKGIESSSPYSNSNENEYLHSTALEDLIESSLDHYAFDDALTLAEAYYSRAGSERSLLILAHCLTRTQNLEGAYYLFKMTNSSCMKSAQSRYIFALCAFALNHLQEAESVLRDETIMDKIELHPSFLNTPTLPFAHSLLAKILSETSRVDLAKTHWASSIRQCPMLWTSIRSYCEIGGNSIRDHLQPLVKLLAVTKATKTSGKSSSEDVQNHERKAVRTPTANRIAVSTERGVITNPERRRTRVRTTGSYSRYPPNNSLTALRASENSPLTRIDKINVDVSLKSSLITPLIELKQQQKEIEEQMEFSTKRVTRRAAAAAAATKERKQVMANAANHEPVDHLFSDLAKWFLQLSEVQEHLSNFRSFDALHILNEMNPCISQLPLSMELRARAFFENGEYKRSCEVFEEIRCLYPRRVQGMEIYSTALWQLHDSKKLSALASKMVEIARDQPQTWCVAGNCFSVEKQHETAIECLERAIRLNHRFGYAYSLLGHELIDMNDLNRAEQAFRKAIQFAPNDYRAWYGLGLVHFKEEQLQMAKICLYRAININSNNTVLLCQLAVIEQALHNTDSAMQYLERALKHSPNNVPCRFHKARLLFDTGHYELARQELEELRVLSPDEAHVFFLLGRVNRKLGNTHMALLNFSWATEIDPRGEQNHSALTQDKGPYDDEPI